MTKRNFEELQKFLGVNYCEHSVLFDDALRQVLKPVDHNIRDWMHTLMSGGVAGTEMSLLLQELQKQGVALDGITSYSLAFTLPKSHGRVSKEWFADKRIAEDQMRTPSASENITMMRILNAFLVDIIAPLQIAVRHCKCFSLLSRIVDLFMLGPEGAMPFVNELQTTIVEHNTLYVELYGDHVKPKLHHLLHIPENMKFVGRLLSCWVTERKHRVVKAQASHTFRHIEHTTTLDLLNDIAEEARITTELYKTSFLLKPRDCSTDDVAIKTSLHLTLPVGTASKGDIVLCSTQAQSTVGAVERFFHINNVLFAQLQMHTPTPNPNVYETANSTLSFVEASIVIDILAWAPHSDTCVRVILPSH